MNNLSESNGLESKLSIDLSSSDDVNYKRHDFLRKITKNYRIGPAAVLMVMDFFNEFHKDYFLNENSSEGFSEEDRHLYVEADYGDGMLEFKFYKSNENSINKAGMILYEKYDKNTPSYKFKYDNNQISLRMPVQPKK